MTTLDLHPDKMRELITEAKQRCMKQCKNPDDRNELFMSLALALESMVHEGVMELEVLTALAALVIIFPETVN